MDPGANRSPSGSSIVRPPVSNKVSLLQQEVTKWGRDYANLETANKVLNNQLGLQQEQNEQRLISMESDLCREKRRIDAERANMEREIAREVEEGVRRFQRSDPPRVEPEPSQASPHTKVAVTASNRVRVDSLGSDSLATLESNQTQDDDERYRLPTPVQETVQNPGGGYQGVLVTNQGIASHLIQETLQHVEQLQAEEAERISQQGEPNTQATALNLRENKHGDSVHTEGIPTPQLANSRENLALARLKSSRSLTAAASGAEDPEDDGRPSYATPPITLRVIGGVAETPALHLMVQGKEGTRKVGLLVREVRGI